MNCVRERSPRHYFCKCRVRDTARREGARHAAAPSSRPRIAFRKRRSQVARRDHNAGVTPSSEDDEDGGRNRGLRRTDVVAALSAALVSLAVAIWSLRLWDWTIGTPLMMSGDSTFVGMQLRDIADQGWYWNNPDLGYPFSQNGAMFPELNVIHVLLVKGLGLFAASPFTPGVVYFVLCFPLAALAMYALARSQGLSPWAGFVAGVLFANAPGHQERFGHLWLAAYWVVPLGMWVVLEVLRGRSLLSARAGSGRPGRWLGLRTWLTVGALTAVGLSGVYYVAFTLVLLLVATVAARWRAGTARGWAPGLLSSAYLTAVLLVPLLAARLATRGEVVTGRVPTARSFAESELFAGKFMDLVLPWSGHRLDPLAHLTFAYNAVTHATVETSALGVVALAGWLSLLVVALRSLVTDTPPDADLRRWSALALVAAAFYTVGGAASFVALFFTPQVRTWSRISLYLLLFGLLAVGWWLTHIEARRGRLTVALVAIAITVVGVLDQTNPGRAPDHAAVARQFADLTAYTRDLQAATRPGCPVFQLPVVPFPESAGTPQMNGYDQLLPYLASDDLRFSSGAMRGTASADWQLGVDVTDTARLAEQLAATGFCAVEVDAQGYTPSTDPRSALQTALGAPVAKSADGVFTAYRLPPGTTDPAARSHLLEPVIVALDAYQVGRDGPQDTVGQWIGPDVMLRLANLGTGAVPVKVTMSVAPEGEVDRVLTFVNEQGKEVARTNLPAGSSTPVTLEVTAPPGTTKLTMRTSGEPVRLTDPSIVVSARVSDLRASTTSEVQVASMQEQVETGTVVP